ncbi:hypothetical protein CDAR_408401 [Caerostris darwini]|uniref:Uncharacterized protein n=1 Tax=Caerostris darwini TaxID=1538125 RepID=A0AAV4TN98_9ARAC|nr:hypothetical protein CDAR_408401 [Caerostris darwini]
MFAKIAFFCAALVAVSAYAPLVNTGVSAVSNQQDAYGNYAYRYDIKDAATGSLNSKAEVGKVGAVAVAAPVAYGVPSVWDMVLVLGYGAGALGLGYGSGVLRAGYGAGVLGAGHGVGILGSGYGAGVLGAGYGAGILGAGLGKAIY